MLRLTLRIKMQSYMDVYNRADIQCEVSGWWYDLLRLPDNIAGNKYSPRKRLVYG